MLLTVLSLAVFSPIAHGENTAFILDEDERINVISLVADQAMTMQVAVQNNTSMLVSWNCQSCQVMVDEQGGEVTATEHGTSMLSIANSNSNTVTLTLSSTEDETVALTLAKNIEHAMSNVRPSPSENAPGEEVLHCLQASNCMNAAQASSVAMLNASQSMVAIHNGVVESSADEYVVINASKGDTLEWQWLMSNHATDVRMYHQTPSEETFLNGSYTSEEAFSELHHGHSAGAQQDAGFWTAPEDGRFVARIATDAARSLWSAHLLLHHHQPVNSLMDVDLANGSVVMGHHETTSPFDWSDVEQFTIHARGGPAEISVDQLMSGGWVTGTTVQLEKDEQWVVYPYPDVSGGRLKVSNTSVFMLDVQTSSFSDFNGLEAPSHTPSDLETDNSSWPVLNLTSPLSGQLTLAVHDTTDTYRIVVDGWEDSIHFVQFAVEGEVTGLELQLWDLDQTTGEVLATDITQPLGDELKIGLQVGRGTHYLQIRFQNTSAATPNLWGEDVEERTYVLRPAYSLIDEGEEPWYPPSEDAVYWGTIARWFMGFLFLLPVVYLAIHVKRSNDYAAAVAEKKQRLAWYTKRLDSGESNPKQTRTDMAKALHAIAQLDWLEGLEAWGPQRLEHRTDDVALAVWSVDERLATVERAWPVVVGVHVMNGTWDLAALRFDSPDGEPYRVVHVEPRFLFQGEEVFLDTMGPGHQAYLIVELQGNAANVDVELNGRMDGEPFAARVPETLQRDQDAS